MKKLLLLLFLFACNSSPTELPLCDGSKVNLSVVVDSIPHLQSSPSLLLSPLQHVKSEDEMVTAFISGYSAIFVDNPITITKTHRLHELLRYNQLVILGVGGFNGSMFWREKDFHGPMFVIEKGDKDWEVRIEGIAIEGHGTFFDFDYIQLGIINDLTIVNNDSVPFIIKQVSAIEFVNVFLRENIQKAKILNAQDWRWRGGVVEDHRKGTGGIFIQGQPRNGINIYPGPGLLEDVRQELSTITIVGIDDMAIVRGYHFSSLVECLDCNGRFSVAGGSWPNSSVIRNGIKVWPEPCKEDI